jgi:hypothetical protein
VVPRFETSQAGEVHLATRPVRCLGGAYHRRGAGDAQRLARSTRRRYPRTRAPSPDAPGPHRPGPDEPSVAGVHGSVAPMNSHAGDRVAVRRKTRRS